MSYLQANLSKNAADSRISKFDYLLEYLSNNSKHSLKSVIALKRHIYSHIYFILTCPVDDIILSFLQ